MKHLKALVFELSTNSRQAQRMSHGCKDLKGLQGSKLPLPLLAAQLILHIISPPADLHNNSPAHASYNANSPEAC